MLLCSSIQGLALQLQVHGMLVSRFRWHVVVVGGRRASRCSRSEVEVVEVREVCSRRPTCQGCWSTRCLFSVVVEVHR